MLMLMLTLRFSSFSLLLGALDNGTFLYADESGFNLDNQVLAFRVTIPVQALAGSGETPLQCNGM